MKTTTLARVQYGEKFKFGGVIFKKVMPSTMKDMIMCEISPTKSTVYIADHALVELIEPGGFVQV